jgi:hypothetical protein
VLERLVPVVRVGHGVRRRPLAVRRAVAINDVIGLVAWAAAIVFSAAIERALRFECGLRGLCLRQILAKLVEGGRDRLDQRLPICRLIRLPARLPLPLWLPPLLILLLRTAGVRRGRAAVRLAAGRWGCGGLWVLFLEEAEAVERLV